MSAFFVTEKTIANAVACMAESGIVADARELWRMNANALVQRYNDNAEDFEADIKAYTSPAPSQDLYQLLKSANCLLYQCAEGNVPETRLYAVLETTAIALMHRLGGKEKVNRDRRYNEAEWD